MTPSEAKVRSLQSLVEWRSSLIIFQTKARRGLGNVLEEIKRLRQWLDTIQRPYWEMEIKKRSRVLDRVQQELITARFSTMRGTLMVQEQAVRKAKAALAHAEDKLRKTKFWCRDFDRVVEPLGKKLENLTFYLDHDLPKGIQLMERMVRSLEGYTQTSLADSSPGPAESGMVSVSPSTSTPSDPT
jgi:hypothetical protein